MRIKFAADYKKTLEAVLWVINKHEGINKYNLLKILFHADYISVNKYGRPVTGDTYLAYPFGTVPDATYRGLINKESLYLDWCFEISEVPLEVKNKYFLYSLRKAEDDYLSESDKDCLIEGIKEYGALSFDEVKEKNHSCEGYKKTREIAPNSPIDWYDLIEDTNLRDELLTLSKYLVI